MADLKEQSKLDNLGTRRIAKLRMADFPNADEIVRRGLLLAERWRKRWMYCW